MKTIEYRVRPVTRYIVTEHTDYGSSGSTTQVGEYANAGMAENVAMRFARAEAVDTYTEGCREQTTKIIHHDGRVYERNGNGWKENIKASARAITVDGDVSVSDVLGWATAKDLFSVAVIGKERNGENYFAASSGDAESVIGLADSFKRFLVGEAIGEEIR